MKADEASTEVIDEVSAGDNYACVTMACEGSDLKTDGWVLHGIWQIPGMDDPASHEPALVESRGVMPIDEFSRATGLDRQIVDALVTGRKVEGLRHTDGRVFGIFDDALPTKDDLRSLGLSVRDDYYPSRHRSYVVADDGPDSASGEGETEGESAGWSMSWGDAET